MRQSYRDFGPDAGGRSSLLERHGVEVSRETLRKMDGRKPASGCCASSAGLSISRVLRRESVR